MITGGRVMEVMELLTQAVEQNAADIISGSWYAFFI